MLHGFGLADTLLPFDGLGLEALFARDPAPETLVTRLGSFSRLISWFGSRDATYPGRLRALSPSCVIAPPVPQDESLLTVWQHLLATIGDASPPDVRPLDVPEAWRNHGDRLLQELGHVSDHPLLIVHPGAGGHRKIWPVERHAEVVLQVIRDTGAQALVH